MGGGCFGDYFVSLFDKQNCVNYTCRDTVKIYVSSSVTPAMAQFLSVPVTMDDIKTALFSFNLDKATCPEGFNAYYFIEAWHIVGNKLLMQF